MLKHPTNIVNWGLYAVCLFSCPTDWLLMSSKTNSTEHWQKGNMGRKGQWNIIKFNLKANTEFQNCMKSKTIWIHRLVYRSKGSIMNMKKKEKNKQFQQKLGQIKPLFHLIRGRPSRRWQDDITRKKGTNRIKKATDRRQLKTLIEGYILQWSRQSLDERRKWFQQKWS